MSGSKRVVVTGGSGGIGSVLVRTLVERGHRVVNIDRKPSPGAPDSVRFVFADLKFRHQYQPSFEGADAVCHLGEIPHPVGYLSRDELFSVNTTIGSGVLQTAADLNIPRVIYTSTCQVYGHWGNEYEQVVPTQFPIDESEPLRPRNQYALSKVANESYAAFVARESATAVSIFRPPWVAFPEQIEGRRLRWMGTDRTTREGFFTYIHVDDLVQAYVLALEGTAVPKECQAYHFVAEDVMCATPIREKLHSWRPDGPQLPEDWPDYKSPVSCDKAKRELGWQPKFSIRQHFRDIFGHDPKPGFVPNAP